MGIFSRILGSAEFQATSKKASVSQHLPYEVYTDSALSKITKSDFEELLHRVALATTDPEAQRYIRTALVFTGNRMTIKAKDGKELTNFELKAELVSRATRMVAKFSAGQTYTTPDMNDLELRNARKCKKQSKFEYSKSRPVADHDSTDHSRNTRPEYNPLVSSTPEHKAKPIVRQVPIASILSESARNALYATLLTNDQFASSDDVIRAIDTVCTQVVVSEGRNSNAIMSEYGAMLVSRMKAEIAHQRKLALEQERLAQLREAERKALEARLETQRKERLQQRELHEAYVRQQRLRETDLKNSWRRVLCDATGMSSTAINKFIRDRQDSVKFTSLLTPYGIQETIYSLPPEVRVDLKPIQLAVLLSDPRIDSITIDYSGSPESELDAAIKQLKDALADISKQASNKRRKAASDYRKAEKMGILAQPDKPAFAPITSHEVFEDRAVEWTRWLGFEAKRSKVGPDKGIDFEGPGVVGQCKQQTNSVGIQQINEFIGACAVGPPRQRIYFSASGYTRSAIEQASRPGAEIALFAMHTYDIVSHNASASKLYSAAEKRQSLKHEANRRLPE